MKPWESRKRRDLFIAAFAVASLFSLSARAQNAVFQVEGSQQYPSATTEDGLRNVAAGLNEARGAAFRRRDTAAVAQFFTPDAVYVELLPRLQVMRGRPEIKAHLDQLIAAESSNVSYSVTSAEAAGKDGLSAGGDYVLTASRNKQIQGHFYEVLHRDGGSWKIAMLVFARPEPVTVGETDNFRGN